MASYYIMISRSYVRRHITSFAIALFIVSYALLAIVKPAFLYNKDGSLRQFGIGLQSRTVVPAWLISIILAIASYFLVLYYLASPKIDL